MHFIEMFDNKPKKIYFKGGTTLNGLNALKFICAIMVVGIHVPFFISPYIEFIYRIAVPIFFMITGYFLLNQEGIITLRRIKVRILHLLKLTVVVNLIYYFYRVHLLKTEIKINIWELIFDGSTISWALWYLNATIFALLFLGLIVRFQLGKIIPYLIVLGIFLNLFFGAYHHLFFDNSFHSLPGFHLSRNFITIGFPCIGIGIMIRRTEKIIIKKFSLLILCFLLLLIESICFRFIMGRNPEGDIIGFTIPFSVIVFIIFLDERMDTKIVRFLNFIAQLGNRHSANIFFYHLIFYLGILQICRFLPFQLPCPGIWLFPSVILLTLLFSNFILFLKNIFCSYFELKLS